MHASSHTYVCTYSPLSSRQPLSSASLQPLSHAAPDQLSLLHKTQELSYKLHTLQGSHERLASTAAAQNPPGTEVQTQTLGVADQLSPQDCEDMQNALECSEHMVRGVDFACQPCYILDYFSETECALKGTLWVNRVGDSRQHVLLLINRGPWESCTPLVIGLHMPGNDA